MTKSTFEKELEKLWSLSSFGRGSEKCNNMAKEDAYEALRIANEEFKSYLNKWHGGIHPKCRICNITEFHRKTHGGVK